METLAEFTILGVAKTAGSKRAGVVTRGDGSIVLNMRGKPTVILRDDTGEAGKAWRSTVQDAAKPFFDHPFDGAVAVEIEFTRTRPKGHYGSGRVTRNVIKDSAPALPVTRPDVDKLSRAILDSLTGIAWVDDSQVTDKIVRKRYGDSDSTRVIILRHSMQSALDLPASDRIKGQPHELDEVQTSLLAA